MSLLRLHNGSKVIYSNERKMYWIHDEFANSTSLPTTIWKRIHKWNLKIYINAKSHDDRQHKTDSEQSNHFFLIPKHFIRPFSIQSFSLSLCFYLFSANAIYDVNWVSWACMLAVGTGSFKHKKGGNVNDVMLLRVKIRWMLCVDFSFCLVVYLNF